MQTAMFIPESWRWHGPNESGFWGCWEAAGTPSVRHSVGLTCSHAPGGGECRLE